MSLDADYDAALGADMEALGRVAQNGQCPFCGENGWHTTEKAGGASCRRFQRSPDRGSPL